MARVTKAAILLGAITLIGTSPGMAQDLEQLFVSTQQALNQLTAEANVEDSRYTLLDTYTLGDTEPEPDADDHATEQGTSEPETPDSTTPDDEIVGGIAHQVAVNAANIISAETVLANVHQIIDGQQFVSNFIEGEFHNTQDGISQSGENLGNIVQAAMIENVEQTLGENTLQQIDNFLRFTGELGFISQTGRNSANIVNADTSINSGAQVFPAGAKQVINNEIDLRDGGLARFIRQSGINLGNVLIADHVEDVSRVFSGDQIVNNTIYVNSPDDIRPTEQTATNIVNYVSASTVNNLTQISDGRQIVNNSIQSETLGEITNHHLVTRSSQNYVNLLHITRQDTDGSTGTIGGAGDGNVGTISAGQTALYDQSVNGSGNHTQVGNAAVIER